MLAELDRAVTVGAPRIHGRQLAYPGSEKTASRSRPPRQYRAAGQVAGQSEISLQLQETAPKSSSKKAMS
jgi:hypothetical protein